MKLKTLAAVLALTCGALHAQSVDVKDAWARATVPGQKATGAFMKLTARDGAKLVAVTSPAAGTAEVHEMKMDGDVMKMRAVSGGLDLPPGKAVELKAGGYHIMLMDLNTTLQKDSSIALTLVFKDGKGIESKQEVKVSVSTGAPKAKADANPHGDAHKH